MRRALCPALLALLLCGCRPAVSRFVYKPLPAEGWEAAEAVVFPIDSIPADGLYALTVCLRTAAANAYPYRSITLHVGEAFPDTARTRLRDVRIPLTDAKGDTNGAGISLFQYEHAADTLRLSAGQRGTISVAHAMRDRVLKGVADVGIRLERL